MDGKASSYFMVKYLQLYHNAAPRGKQKKLIVDKTNSYFKKHVGRSGDLHERSFVGGHANRRKFLDCVAAGAVSTRGDIRC